jgi:hypothetical protein
MDGEPPDVLAANLALAGRSEIGEVKRHSSEANPP